MNTAAGFNRTILELKLAHVEELLFDACSFNRTMLELKHEEQYEVIRAYHVLIVPYWN